MQAIHHKRLVLALSALSTIAALQSLHTQESVFAGVCCAGDSDCQNSSRKCCRPKGTTQCDSSNPAKADYCALVSECSWESEKTYLSRHLQYLQCSIPPQRCLNPSAHEQQHAALMERTARDTTTVAAVEAVKTKVESAEALVSSS